MTTSPTHSGPFADVQTEAAGFNVRRLQRLGEVLQADCDAAAIPGAVVLVTRGEKTAYFESFGHADRNGGKRMQRESIFRIASMTKPVTVVAALMLMERGRLLLTDSVARFLPVLGDVQVGIESPAEIGGQKRLTLEPPRRAMTIQDLMRHTAGFTYGQFGNSLVQRAYRAANVLDNQQTNADMIAKLAKLPLAYQPGTTFEYGMSTDVLGAVVEVISGMSLDRFIGENITGPLGMVDTAFGVQPDGAARVAEPQRDAAAPVPVIVPYDPARPTHWFSGGGGLLSTASDYTRFTRMLLECGESNGVRLLSRKSIELMTCSHLPAGLSFGPHTVDLGIAAPLPHLGLGYGLGLGVRLDAALAGVPGSPGDYFWGGALGPYFWVDPVERLSVVFMLQELNVQRRTRYRALLRSLVYQALE